MGVFYRAGEFIGGISKELVDEIHEAKHTVTQEESNTNTIYPILFSKEDNLQVQSYTGKVNKDIDGLGYNPYAHTLYVGAAFDYRYTIIKPNQIMIDDYTMGISNRKTITITNTDITLADTWDETNTSLKSALDGKATKATTLAGYGITDAKIANGVITLGSNSITPLTSHQSVTDNNPTLAWGAKSKVATIGSTEINVTMPSNPNTDTKVKQNLLANASGGFLNLLLSDTVNTEKTAEVKMSRGLSYDTRGGVLKLADIADDSSPRILVDNGSKSCNYWYNDVILSGDTWDGTNTSLKSTLTSLKSTLDAKVSQQLASIGSGATTHSDALKAYFDNNKSTIPRNRLNSFYSSAAGNGSQYFGYFLSGYDSNPYGGYFVAHYNKAYYVGIQNGAYKDHELMYKEAFSNTEFNDDTNTSIPSGSWKTKKSFTLTKGLYIIQVYAEWASVKGYSRQVGVSDTNNGSPMGYRYKDVRTILGQTSQCWQSVTFPLYVDSASKTYYTVVYHNSDSACNCITRTAYYKVAL